LGPFATQAGLSSLFGLCSWSFLAAPTVFAAGVVINEIHYDEDNPTIHSEFIELYNAGALQST
jgi:hypothetical protein